MKDSERFRWQQYLLRHTQLDLKSGCWVWQLLRYPKGYGRSNEARNVGVEEAAHRLAYIVFIGPIPDGQQARHQCHNAACCNPAHLLPGTHLDNRNDNRRDGLHVGSEKLTAAQVAEIRRLLKLGTYTQGQIGALFGVTHSTIGYIKRGNTWVHVEPATGE